MIDTIICGDALKNVEPASPEIEEKNGNYIHN